MNYTTVKNVWNPFEITINTNNVSAGSSSTNQFRLPLLSGNIYKFKVSWGDGSGSNITSWNQAEVTHTYASAGTYTVKIYGRCDRFAFVNTGDRLKILSVVDFGNIVWKSLSDMFYGCTNMVGTFTEPPITQRVTSIASTFRGCTNFNSPLNTMDTSKITDMSNCFNSATNFNQNIGNWVTSGVTNMGGMLAAQEFNNGGSPSINNWNTSSVTNMNSMFSAGLSAKFNQPIGNWNVSKCNSFILMFYQNPVFNQNLGAWRFNETGGTITIGSMFWNCIQFNNSGSTSISGWTINKVTDLSYVFRQTAFNQPIGSWDVSNVTNMASFLNLSSGGFNQNLSSWNVSKVVDFASAFSCAGFNNGGNPAISGWTINSTGSSVSMSGMFQGSSFNQPIGSWNTSKVTNMASLFRSTPFNQNISSWNTSLVSNMSLMFFFNSQFNQNISTWITSANTTMEWMFYGATNFNQPIGNWITSGVTNMDRLFLSANNFNQNLGNWDLRSIVSGSSRMSQFFSSTAMSNLNYSNTLSGWLGWTGGSGGTASKSISSNITFSSSAKYLIGTDGQWARNYLTGTKTWTITDGGGI